VRLIREARSRGVKISGEVCPHHIALTDETLAAFDSNLVEIGGTFMPIKGKMTADQEFAIYDQKFQKSVRFFFVRAQRRDHGL
jgi:hypothetical protein